MHVVIIPSEQYVTFRNPLSGIFQYHHARLLKSHGFQIGVVSAGLIPFNQQFKSFPYKKYTIEDDIPVYRHYIRSFIPGRIAMRVAHGLIEKLYLRLFLDYIKKYGKPDLIHAHNCLYAGLVAMDIKKMFGIPFVITEHSSAFERGLVNKKQIELSRKVMYSADARTVVSNCQGEKLKEVIGELIIPFTAIYNVLEEIFVEQDIQNVSVGSGFTFLSIGSLDENKNHISLVRTFAKAFSKEPNVYLKIVGDGPERESLKTAVSTLGVTDRVKFCGSLSRQQVIEEIKSCNAFVLPSKVETFGVVIIEALSLGKPVIATNSGGPADIINDKNGLLVPILDDESLIIALQRMYSQIHQYNSYEIRQDCIERFGSDTFYRRLDEIYKNVLIKNNYE